MKMAKASEADIELALDLSSAFDELNDGWPTLPDKMAPKQHEDDGISVLFDRDNDKQCGEVLRYLLDTAKRGSLFRVAGGMPVALDPDNKIVDPNANTLEHHPDIVSALAAVATQPAWHTRPPVSGLYAGRYPDGTSGWARFTSAEIYNWQDYEDSDYRYFGPIPEPDTTTATPPPA